MKRKTPFKLHFEALRRWYSHCNDSQKKTFILQAVLKIAILFFVSTLVTGSLCKWTATAFTAGNAPKGIIYYAFSNGLAFTFTILFAAAVIFLALSLEAKNPKQEKEKQGIEDATEKVVDNLDDKVMTKEEAKRVYQVGDINKTKSTVIGMFDKYGTQTISMKQAKDGSTGNQNLLVIGSPGTGKSYVFARTNIIQAARRGDSIVITDPAGELYRDQYVFLKKNGYDVWILNTSEPSFSDFWNCLDEVINDETERLDGTKLNEFADIYINNSGETNNYWAECSFNLLRVAIGYIFYQKESIILAGYQNLFDEISDNSLEEKYIREEMKEMVSFVWCKEQIREVAKKHGKDLKEIEEKIKKINDEAPAHSMKDVYDVLLNYKKMDEEEHVFENIGLWHPLAEAYILYKDSNSSVKDQVINNVRLRFKLFTDKNLKNMVSYDGINLKKVNKEKTAIFVCMSDKTSVATPIISLFFSFLFKEVQDNWDKADKFAMVEGTKNDCLDTYVLLDEFFSLGVIGGDPKQFAKTLSVNRKRHISINVIIQNLSQIETLYNKDNKATIINCCDHIMFLGTNDLETAKFVSEFIGGKALYRNESHKESTSLFGTLSDGLEVNVSSRSELLWAPDELRKFKNKILFAKRGEKPIVCEPFPWTLHPANINGEIIKTNIYKNMEPIDKRVKDMEKQDYLNKLANNKVQVAYSRARKEKKNNNDESNKQLQLDFSANSKKDLDKAKQKRNQERIKFAKHNPNDLM